MAQIEFRNVNFTYPGDNAPTLNNINFKVEQSNFVLICGKSGCGKSTLLRQIKKNLIPFGDFEGKVMYENTDITEIDDRKGVAEIGFVQQNPENQIVTDKVWHELAFGLESLGYSNQTIRRRVSEMASFFGIQTWFRKNICELSGGQKQLLNLASIMAMQPKVLILDEPTSQLDPIASMEFLETLARINRELGTTIIISEHRLEELFTMVDKAIVMENGKILIDDTVEKVADFLGENKNVMYQGLPAATKIYSQFKIGSKCPVTVREGRQWLNGIFSDKECKIKSVQENISEKSKKTAEILFDDVWFRYDKNGDDIIRGMNLNVFKGEIFGMVGGNGVGKSTTLKLISGIKKPYRGKVFIRGNDINKAKNEVKIGVLPQNPQSLFTEITVEEEMLEALYYEKTSYEKKCADIDNMLKILMLDHLKKSHPYDLSGGEQQRLALGKILLLKPEVLLLDEPTKGLDPYIKSVLATILKNLSQNGVTTIMVTHDIEFAAENSDRCAMVFDGDIVSCENPRTFFGGNSFYTTAANRISRNIFENAVTCQDVIDLCAANLTQKDI